MPVCITRRLACVLCRSCRAAIAILAIDSRAAGSLVLLLLIFDVNMLRWDFLQVT
jgi:hypothetical protein